MIVEVQWVHFQMSHSVEHLDDLDPTKTQAEKMAVLLSYILVLNIHLLASCMLASLLCIRPTWLKPESFIECSVWYCAMPCSYNVTSKNSNAPERSRHILPCHWEMSYNNSAYIIIYPTTIICQTLHCI